MRAPEEADSGTGSGVVAARAAGGVVFSGTVTGWAVSMVRPWCNPLLPSWQGWRDCLCGTLAFPRPDELPPRLPGPQEPSLLLSGGH